MLEKLNALLKENTVIKLKWPQITEPIVVKPLQPLEEDYESYLVEVIEGKGFYNKGSLLEVCEKDLEYVEKA